MAELTKEQIERAVTWWGEQLQAPSFDNGDDSKMGVLCNTMANRAHKSQPDKKINKFKSELKDRLRGCNEFVHLDVDYDPCKILRESAKAADISISITSFPWKTNMCFEDGKIMVSRGYRAPYVEVT